jgi:hypothetical protein
MGNPLRRPLPAIALLSLAPACSATGLVERDGPGASIGFQLRTPEGVTITSASYALETQAGADVQSSAIPVRGERSTINGIVDGIAPGSYRLRLFAVATYQEALLQCASEPALFDLISNDDLVLPNPLELKCTLTSSMPEASVRVTLSATATLEESIEVRRIVESFGVTPIVTVGHPPGPACTYPPIAIEVANLDPQIAYDFSATPDGAFALNAANTHGTYRCSSGGTKNLTLTARLGGAVGSRSIQVLCTGCEQR